MDYDQAIPLVEFHKSPKITEIDVLSLASLVNRNLSGKIASNIFRFHRLNFHQIIYVKSGEGSHFIDFKEYKFTKGDIFLVAKNQVQYFCENQNVEATIILCTTNFLESGLVPPEIGPIRALLGFSRNGFFKINIAQPSTGEKLIEILEQEFRQGSKELLRQVLVALFITLDTAYANPLLPMISPEKLRLMMEIDNLLTNDQLNCRDATRYAGAIGCSYKHLNSVCKQVSGKTIKEYLDSKVILEIKRQLATTGLSIKELSWRFAFDEETNFVKYFKKHAQVSPKKFRDQYLA